MDIIRIKDLEVFYHVGVTPEERANAQRLLLCLELEQDFGPAVASDNLGETIDYSAVCRRLLQFGTDRQWQLIETLSVDIATAVLEEFKPRSVLVEVKKFIIPQAAFVSVKARRTLR
jgi:FolB domain-containing protein